MKKLLGSLLFGSMIMLAGCQNDGPAEQAGEGIDNAAREAQDAVTSDGPLEKAGENVDKAVNP